MMGTRQQLKDGDEFDLLTWARHNHSSHWTQKVKKRLAKRRRKEAKLFILKEKE